MPSDKRQTTTGASTINGTAFNTQCSDSAGHNVKETKAVFTLAILPDARTCPCTHCVHCVGFVRYTQTTSGGVRSGRERYASGWRCSVNARVDASGASGTAATRRLRMSADYLFLSTPLMCNAANRAKSWHCGGESDALTN